MHVTVEPAILYLGTLVVLISTVNEDGSYNLAPMSSAFWLGWRCILGLAAGSKTPQNMIRTGQCVLNLPSSEMVESVNRLALTTGSTPVPEGKKRRGYRYEKDKFSISELTPVSSEMVCPPRVLECPIQLEAVVEAKHMTWPQMMTRYVEALLPSRCVFGVCMRMRQYSCAMCLTESTRTDGGRLS